MNINKAITGMMTVGVLMGVGAGAAMAQTFSYTTVFTPNPVVGSGAGNIITITDGAAAAINAGGIGSAINLSNLKESSTAINPAGSTFTQPFTIALSITPLTGPTQTQNLTGIFSGTFNTTQSITMTSFTAPGTATFNFGSLGTYTVGNLSFTQPGPMTTSTSGAIAGTVNFTPSSAVPEPASVIPFALGGLGLLGLIARKTRRSSGAAA